MEPVLATPETPLPSIRRRWRLAALCAAGSLALAACGATVAGAGSTPARSAPVATAPSIPITPGTGVTTAGAPAPATTADVGIVNFKFTPASLTVKVGTTVVWTNRDAIGHTVNFTTAGVNSAVLNQNDKFSHTFSTPGTYDYICSIHPFMHGSVTVTT